MSFRDGQRVRLDTGLADDDGQVARGTVGRVLGDNCEGLGSDGKGRVQVLVTEGPNRGQVVAAPRAAVKNKDTR